MSICNASAAPISIEHGKYLIVTVIGEMPSSLFWPEIVLLILLKIFISLGEWVHIYKVTLVIWKSCSRYNMAWV